MLRNYLHSAIRSLTKNRTVTVINIISLTVGLSLCLAVVGHISYELSFEDFHHNSDRIYRLNGSHFLTDDIPDDVIEKRGGVRIRHTSDALTRSVQVMAPAGKILVEDLPEVENAAVFRVSELKNLKIDNKVIPVENRYRNQAFAHHAKVIYADKDYFKVFNFPLSRGNIESALDEPYALLISESAAKKYFNDPSPIGQSVILNEEIDCHITGILKDVPQNTQLYTDFVLSYATLERMGKDVTSWDQFGTDYTYLLLSEGADPQKMAAQINRLLSAHLDLQQGERYEFNLQPLRKIYFGSMFSGRMGELSPMGEVSVIYTIGIIALFILIQAISNFVNLSTAKSVERQIEVGVRKVFGANKPQLMRQFFGESLVIAMIATVLSIGVYEIFQAKVHSLLPRDMFVHFFDSPLMIGMVILLGILVGLAAGFYPALYLAGFRPAAVLSKQTGMRSGRSLLRKGLVVFQFTVAVVFIVATIIVYRQTSFITGLDLGFKQNNMLVLKFEGENSSENCQIMKSEILNKVNVVSATAANSPPGTRTFNFYGFYKDPELSDEDRVVARLFQTDSDYLKTFGLELKAGRWFRDDGSDNGQSILITERSAKSLGWDDPVGQKFYKKNGFFEVIGVLKDFHGSPLDWSYQQITVLENDPSAFSTVTIELHPENVAGTLTQIAALWQETLPTKPFVYSFLNEEIDNNYNSTRGQGLIFLWLSGLSILIACLGVFGLVGFTAQKRSKEIGIRKVLGCSVKGIVGTLSKEFVILIGISNLIAWPIGYLIASSFLQEFPYRVPIGPGTFILALVITILLAMLTSGYQALKAATANLIDVLRYE